MENDLTAVLDMQDRIESLNRVEAESSLRRRHPETDPSSHLTELVTFAANRCGVEMECAELVAAGTLCLNLYRNGQDLGVGASLNQNSCEPDADVWAFLAARALLKFELLGKLY